MNSIRIGIVVAAATWACAPKPTEGGSSSTSSSGGGTSSTSSGGAQLDGGIPIDDYCATLASALCQSSTCNTEVAPSRCHAFESARCQAEVTASQPHVDYDPLAARRCVDVQQELVSIASHWECTSNLYDEESITAFMRVWLGTPSCVSNVSVTESPLSSCDHVFNGTRPPGSPCGQSVECSKGSMDDVLCSGPDGGCGTCVESPPVSVGNTCVFDGGARKCAGDAICDTISRNCIPQRLAGQTCGAGVGYCAEGCGYYCSGSPSLGTGTCRPYEGEGGSCNYAGSTGEVRLCDNGFSCVYPLTDAGQPDRSVLGTCRRKAELGEPCSSGLPAIPIPAVLPYVVRGGDSFGGLPTCASPNKCLVQDGGTSRVCLPWELVDVGEPCGNGRYCVDRVTCTALDGGEHRCVDALGPGESCTYDEDCRYDLWCSRSWTCTARLADGTSCTDADRCLGTCSDGTCVPDEQALQPIPQCQ